MFFEIGKQMVNIKSKNNKKFAKTIICRYCGISVPQRDVTTIPTIPEQLSAWIEILGPEFAENIKQFKTNSICLSHIENEERGPYRLPKNVRNVTLVNSNPIIKTITKWKRRGSMKCRYCGISCSRLDMTKVPIIPKQLSKWIEILGPDFAKTIEKFKTNSICLKHIENRDRSFSRLPKRMDFVPVLTPDDDEADGKTTPKTIDMNIRINMEIQRKRTTNDITSTDDEVEDNDEEFINENKEMEKKNNRRSERLEKQERIDYTFGNDEIEENYVEVVEKNNKEMEVNNDKKGRSPNRREDDLNIAEDEFMESHEEGIQEEFQKNGEIKVGRAINDSNGLNKRVKENHEEVSLKNREYVGKKSERFDGLVSENVKEVDKEQNLVQEMEENLHNDSQIVIDVNGENDNAVENQNQVVVELSSPELLLFSKPNEMEQQNHSNPKDLNMEIDNLDHEDMFETTEDINEKVTERQTQELEDDCEVEFQSKVDNNSKPMTVKSIKLKEETDHLQLKKPSFVDSDIVALESDNQQNSQVWKSAEECSKKMDKSGENDDDDDDCVEIVSDKSIELEQDVVEKEDNWNSLKYFQCRVCKVYCHMNRMTETPTDHGRFLKWLSILGPDYVENVVHYSPPHFVCKSHLKDIIG